MAQILPQPIADVRDVAHAAAGPLIAPGCQAIAHPANGAVEGPFGIDGLGANEIVGPPREERIVEHQQLSRENRRVCGPYAAGEPHRDLLELDARAFPRAAEPLAL